MTSDDEAKAQAIIDSWFWQMSESHSFRWSKAVKSMTLFYESAPMSSDIAQLVVQYLKTREGVTDFIINHKKWHFDAPGWNAKEASYVTAPGEKWTGTESTKVRIYWTLVQAGDGTADGPYTVENGCKYLVTHEYYWDVTSQPTLPPSTSGVQYSIQGFTRDKETGLFTYIIEKRETVQQDIALYKSTETAFETMSEEQHLGVKQNLVDSTGLQAGVGNGTRTERHLSKNADCTTDIVNHKIEEKAKPGTVKVWRKTLRGTIVSTTDRSQAAPLNGNNLEVGETRRSEMTEAERWNNTVETTDKTPVGTVAEECKKTIFEHQDVEIQNVATKPQPTEVPAPVDGVMKEKSIRKTDENTFDVVDTTKTELKVEQSHTVERKTLRGTSAATTDRNISAAELAAKTATPIAEGETRTVEKTPGDKRNLTVETFTPSETPVTVAQSCEKTSAVETDTTVTAVKLSEIGTVHPQTPEVNKKKTVSFRKNEDGKTADKTVVTETHSLQTASGGSSQGGVVTTTTTRKQNATAEEPTGSAGVNQVIEVDNQPNGMGGFNSVKRTTTHATQRASGTGSQGGVVSTTTERTQNGTSEVSGGSAAVNQVIEVDNQPNGMGGFNSVKRTTTHTTQRASGTGSQGGVVSTTTERTQNGTSEVNAPTAGVNQVIEVDNQPNGMGGFNSVKRTTTYTERQAIATSNFATERAVTTTTTHTTGQANAACGTANASPNDHGSKTTQVTEYTPIACDSGWIKWESVEKSPSHTYTYECGIRVFKNLPQVPGAPGGSRVQVSANINRYGLYDGSIAYSKLIRWAQGGNSGVYGGSQAGSIEFTYVSDYQISDPNGDGDVKITPVFATANVTTRAYYGYGNEGSEALARANSQSLPGLHLAHRTYITSNTSSIVRAMKQAEAKLQAALANRKARGT